MKDPNVDRQVEVVKAVDSITSGLPNDGLQGLIDKEVNVRLVLKTVRELCEAKRKDGSPHYDAKATGATLGMKLHGLGNVPVSVDNRKITFNLSAIPSTEIQAFLDAIHADSERFRTQLKRLDESRITDAGKV